MKTREELLKWIDDQDHIVTYEEIYDFLVGVVIPSDAESKPMAIPSDSALSKVPEYIENYLMSRTGDGSSKHYNEGFKAGYRAALARVK